MHTKYNIVSLVNEYRQCHYPELQKWKWSEEFAFFDKYRNITVPDYLVWGLSLRSGIFSYLGSMENVSNSRKSLEEITNIIKPSFRSYFRDVFETVFSITTGVIDEKKDFYIKVVLPLQLRKGSYTLSGVNIVPFTANHLVVAIVFIVNPLMPYTHEPFRVKVVNNGRKDEELTAMFRNHVKPVPLGFTKDQEEIVIYIRQECSVSEISKFTGKATSSIYKINKRLLEKLSVSYGMNFKNVYQAVKFHYNCFQ